MTSSGKKSVFSTFRKSTFSEKSLRNFWVPPVLWQQKVFLCQSLRFHNCSRWQKLETWDKILTRALFWPTTVWRDILVQKNRIFCSVWAPTVKASSGDISGFFKFHEIFFWLRIVSICRPEVLDGLLKRYDAEVLFFEAMKHVCLMYAHVVHQAHRRFFGGKCWFLMIFRGVENFSKNFPKFVFVKNRQRIVSFR